MGEFNLAGRPGGGRVILKLIELFGVAALFALCGAWSSEFYSHGTTDFLLGAPFALVLVILLARNTWAVLVFPAIVVTWLPAWFVAASIEVKGGDEYMPMSIAGSVGAICVALAAGIARRPLVSPLRLAGAGAVGFLAGLAFGPWLTYSHFNTNNILESAQSLRLRYAFAVWQSAVGSYIYSVARGYL
jgi:hypothetical protein